MSVSVIQEVLVEVVVAQVAWVAGGALGGAVGLRAMLGNFLPAMAVGSIGGGIGFGAARGVQAARDQTRIGMNSFNDLQKVAGKSLLELLCKMKLLD